MMTMTTKRSFKKKINIILHAISVWDKWPYLNICASAHTRCGSSIAEYNNIDIKFLIFPFYHYYYFILYFSFSLSFSISLILCALWSVFWELNFNIPELDRRLLFAYAFYFNRWRMLLFFVFLLGWLWRLLAWKWLSHAVFTVRCVCESRSRIFAYSFVCVFCAKDSPFKRNAVKLSVLLVEIYD